MAIATIFIQMLKNPISNFSILNGKVGLPKMQIPPVLQQ